MMLYALTAGSGSPLAGGAPLTPSTPRSRRVVHSLSEPPVSGLFNATGWSAEAFEALAFLQQHQPASDAASLNEDVLRVGVWHALEARNATAWARAVPWDIFLNDVLPYAVLNEARDNWRPLFHHAFMPLVRHTSSTVEAALALNAHIWDHLDVQYEEKLSPHITAPLEAVAYKRASCTGLSVLLVDACRAVGIPARMALVGQWAPPNSGNHNWVEVWVLPQVAVPARQCLASADGPPPGALAALAGSALPAERVAPLGARPRPRLPERAASKAAHSPAFDPSGGRPLGVYWRLRRRRRGDEQDVVHRARPRAGSERTQPARLRHELEGSSGGAPPARRRGCHRHGWAGCVPGQRHRSDRLLPRGDAAGRGLRGRHEGRERACPPNSPMKLCHFTFTSEPYINT